MKLIFCLQINTKNFYKLIVSLWVCIDRHAQSTENNKLTISFQYLKENVKDKGDFLPPDKHQRFLQSNTGILGARITQNNKFAISLHYLKREVSDEADFLHLDKHENLLQIGTKIWMVMVKHSQSSQNSKFAMSKQYLKKEARDKVDFLHADKRQSFLQVDFSTLGIRVSYKVLLSLLMGMIKHSKSTQRNKFAISLQYLKKEVRNGVHFCMQINIKVSTSWPYYF